MATPVRALILSNLQLGQGTIPRETRELLSSLGSGPPVALILAGGLIGAQDLGPREAEVRDALAFLGRSVQGESTLTVLSGPGEPLPSGGRRALEEWLGRRDGQVLYEEELAPGLSGARLQAEEGVVWVLPAGTLDPLQGTPLGEALSWGPLRSFVRAFARQLSMGVSPPEMGAPQQVLALALARAVAALSRPQEGQSPEVSRARGESLLGEVLRHLESGAAPGAEVNQVLDLARALLDEVLIGRVRGAADDAAAAVVVGGGGARAADEEAPWVFLGGSAGGARPTWVEVSLLGSLRAHVVDRSGRPGPAAPVAPAGVEPPAPPAAVEPPAAPAAPPAAVDPPAAAAPPETGAAAAPPETGAAAAPPETGAAAAPAEAAAAPAESSAALSESAAAPLTAVDPPAAEEAAAPEAGSAAAPAEPAAGSSAVGSAATGGGKGKRRRDR
jgi:hypothetical protein